MCGRYAASKDPDELVEEFEVDLDLTGRSLAPDYNLAPTKTGPVVLTRPLRDPDKHDLPSGLDPATPIRQLRALRWGLVPSWAKDPGIGGRMINARMEQVATKAAFRKPLRSRRCLVPADGWYEWQASPAAVDPKGKPRKQPFFLARRDGASTAFAGLYEFWRNPAMPDKDDPAAWLITYSILTRPAEPGLDRIHDRMPLVLEQADWGEWLDPEVRADAHISTMLETAAALAPGRFVAVPVSPAVGNVNSTGPQLTEALPVDDTDVVVDSVTGEVLSGQQELSLAVRPSSDSSR